VNYDPLDKKMREPASLFVPLLKDSGIKARLLEVDSVRRGFRHGC
jgi:hypothetical protein